MKITVEFEDSEISEICQITGERKKGPAIKKLVHEMLLTKKREQIAAKFLSGEWGVELGGFEEARTLDRAVKD